MNKTKSDTRYLWWTAIVFLLLAISFVFDFWGKAPERIHHPIVQEEFFTKDPVRQAKLAPIMNRNGELYSCNECHSIIEPSDVQKSYFSAHPEIVLKHGVNNYCTTCHDKHDREKLIDINHKPIAFNQSQQTCLQCHGPIYRDWENGVHGRMNDYWDERKGPTRKLTCVQCHDPHQPHFPSMQPSPKPQVKNYRYFLEKFSTHKDDHGHE